MNCCTTSNVGLKTAFFVRVIKIITRTKSPSKTLLRAFDWNFHRVVNISIPIFILVSHHFAEELLEYLFVMILLELL